MKVTKAMLKKAEDEHFKKEDEPSLVKLHSLSSLYYSQRGDTKTAKSFITGKDVQQKVLELGAKKKRKGVLKGKVKSKKSAPIGSAEWVKQETGL